ncbi:hypothetical protein DOK_11686 [gamma proteobacterium BDW918]|nr:hypothetical protein DOK_11686 [gamma proteobacterium BDW918]
MKLSKREVLSFFEERGASRNELDRKSLIFQDSNFQDWLLSHTGTPTELNTAAYSEPALKSQHLSTLADLDVFDLEEFIHENGVTKELAETVSAAQLNCLSEKCRSEVMSALDEERAQEREIWYSLVELVQTGLPFSPVEGKQHFERRNGDLTVTFSAPNDQKLPSGIYARAIFVWLSTEAVKSKSSEANLGNSLKRFVTDTLGQKWTTGKRGNNKTWEAALTSVLSMSITVVRKGRLIEKGEGTRIDNFSVAKKAVLWSSDSYEKDVGAYIEFDDSFLDALKRSAVPGSAEAMRAILNSSSCMAFDAYCWITYRYFRLEQSGNAVADIPWRDLWRQSGSNYGELSRFKQAFIQALAGVKEIYPEANFSDGGPSSSHLRLYRSTPHISPQRILQKEIKNG